MAKSDARLLALTLALRQARAVISKHERMLTKFFAKIPDDPDITPSPGTDLMGTLLNETRQCLHQIDEALK